MISRRGGIVFGVILIATLAADQGSKVWAHTLPVRPAGCAQPADLLAYRCAGVAQPVVDGYWDWELAYNPAIAFSAFVSFAEQPALRVVLALLAAAALVGITWMAVRTRPDERWKRAALALIAGGALGNLVDRLRDGAVTDFIRWRIHDHRWPVFNLADAALVLGIVMMLLASLRTSRRVRAA